MINFKRIEGNVPFIESGKLCYNFKTNTITPKENDQPYWAMQSLFDPVLVRYAQRPAHIKEQQMIPIRASFEDNIQLLDALTFNKLVEVYNFIREDVKKKVRAQYGRNTVVLQGTESLGVFEHTHIATTIPKTLTYILDCTKNYETDNIVIYQDDKGQEQVLVSTHREYDLCCFTLDPTKPHRTDGEGHGLIYWVFEEVDTDLPFNYVERLHSPFN